MLTGRLVMSRPVASHRPPPILPPGPIGLFSRSATGKTISLSSRKARHLTESQCDTGLDPDRIVAPASGDWNKDGANDLALLVQPAEDGEEDNAIYLYLNSEVGRLTLQ